MYPLVVVGSSMPWSIMVCAIAGRAAASVMTSNFDFPIAPATPVTIAPAACAASRRLGTIPNPRAAETGMVAYPAIFQKDGDF